MRDECKRNAGASHRALAFILVSAGGLFVGCGDDDTAAVPTDGGTTDATDPVRPADASSDVDAGATEWTRASDVCAPEGEGGDVVAVSSDGVRAAYLVCADGKTELWAVDLEQGRARMVTGARSGDEVQFLIDDRFVAFGAQNSFFVVDVTGSDEPVSLSVGTSGRGVREFRSFLLKVDDTEFEPRLLVRERVGDKDRVSVRGPEDGYRQARTLFERDEVLGGLDQLSASGRTLILISPANAGSSMTAVPTYFRVRTNFELDPFQMPFGPSDWVMAPVGLGDNHNFARAGDRLARVQLERGTEEILVDAESGLLEGDDHLIERQASAGRKFLHFIVDGNPSFRFREKPEENPIVTLATAEAVGQALSPDEKIIVYLSEETLWSVPAGGDTDAIAIGTDVGSSGAADSATRFRVAFSPDSAEVAFINEGGTLFVGSVETEEGVAALGAGDAMAGSAAYVGSSVETSQLVWIADAPDMPRALLRSSVGSDQVRVIALNVDAWWPIPDSDEVLYWSEGVLARAAI